MVGLVVKAADVKSVILSLSQRDIIEPDVANVSEFDGIENGLRVALHK